MPTVVIPTFDEPESAPLAVEHVRRACDRDLNVLVVDDSPDDRTVRALYDCDPVPRILDGPRDGLAAAILYGIREALTDRVAVIDADLQHPPETVPQLFDALGDADLAVGSRFVGDGGVDDGWPVYRRVISEGADQLARVAVPQARGLSDPLSGLFAVRRSTVTAADEFDPAGYKALLSIIARCPVQRVVEVPYRFGDRQHGDSELGPREYVRYARHLTRLARPARRPSFGTQLADVRPHKPPEVTLND